MKSPSAIKPNGIQARLRARSAMFAQLDEEAWRHLPVREREAIGNARRARKRRRQIQTASRKANRR